MKMIYGRQDMPTFERAQENCYLLTNGLGGYSSLSAAFSMTRGDHGLLMSARTAPNDRVNLVARMQETLCLGGKEYMLSTQEFADDTPQEEGYQYLSSLAVEATPRWVYDVRGVRVTREVGMAWLENACAVSYWIENRTAQPCTLTLHPWVLGFEKAQAPEKKWPVSMADGCITTNGMQVYVKTNGTLMAEKSSFCMQAYMHDEPDGRPEKGLVANVCSVECIVAPGENKQLWIIFADKKDSQWSSHAMLSAPKCRRRELCRDSGLQDEVAQQLVWAADAYIARRDSTGGKTILAGYPFFGDWGRDTMIALPGCCLATKRYEDAKSILRTFLQYEKDGLVPNLFPEGTAEPMYNTVDAALLLFSGVYEYVRKSGDEGFIAEAWPVLERIVSAYKRGTHFGIHMDRDGLICAGQGLDQVTWMDVRVGEILPTPRHGKPVEINAYWYSALMIMAEFAAKMGQDGSGYAKLAAQVRASFLDAFWMADKQYLKDVISGTAVDEQIRCNQIWAITQPFTMLSPAQEKAVVDTVYQHLYTPSGLRTLSPEDEQYHPTYGGAQKVRDMAYHQGTAWVFPLGAYYLAYLKVHGHTAEAARAVRNALLPVYTALREGCIGQLPEIYDGEMPSFSRGCFAQAWSVGEMLRVYEAIENIESKEESEC